MFTLCVTLLYPKFTTGEFLKKVNFLDYMQSCEQIFSLGPGWIFYSVTQQGLSEVFLFIIVFHCFSF